MPGSIPEILRKFSSGTVDTIISILILAESGFNSRGNKMLQAHFRIATDFHIVMSLQRL